jgi:hypothetical protein
MTAHEEMSRKQDDEPIFYTFFKRSLQEDMPPNKERKAQVAYIHDRLIALAPTFRRDNVACAEQDSSEMGKLLREAAALLTEEE